MSAPSRDEALQQALSDAVAATFGGEVPAFIGELLDLPVCSELVAAGAAKLGYVFQVGGAERPRIRVSLENEKERLIALLVARWPAAKRFFDAYGEGHLLAETDGGDWLRLISTGVEAGPPIAGHPVIGAMLTLATGELGLFTFHAQLPFAELAVSPVLTGHARWVQEAGLTCKSLIRWVDGAPVVLACSTEQPTPPAQLARLRATSTGARFKAALAALEQDGRVADPYLLEFYDRAEFDITLWGIQAAAKRAHDLPAFFEPGKAPAAAAFAEHVAMALPDGDRAAAAAIVVSRIYPALAAQPAAASNPYAHFADAWRWLIGRLAKEVPFYRLDVLRTIGTLAAIKALEVPAYHYALARYAASHPDKALEVPARLGGLSVDALLGEARTQLAALDALVAELSGATGLGSKQIPALVVEPEAVKDTLQRAISGDFTAAVGLLHDLFMHMGPGGYDDDPSLASLDDIDLEAGEVEAAIEEALASDDDF